MSITLSQGKIEATDIVIRYIDVSIGRDKKQPEQAESWEPTSGWLFAQVRSSLESLVERDPGLK